MTEPVEAVDNSQQRYLIIQADLGLCNRLMALASYFPIAEYTGRVLKMNWVADAAVVDCQFADLFKNDLVVRDIYALDIGGSLRGLHLSYGVADSLASDMELINRIPDYPERIIGVTMSCYFEPEFIDRKCYHRSIRQFLLDLCPVDSMQSAITGFCKSQQIAPDNPGVVGLHVRRADGQREQYLSTDAQFMEMMESILRREASTKFYLSTDCPDTERTFRARYPDSIISYPREYLDKQFRGTTMVEAVVDLYILANTHYIYGSYGSSYSKVASIMRGCDFFQVGFDQPTWT